MFEKILFATTGTPTCDHAAHVAFDLAKKYQSKLFLFHVFGVPTRGFSRTVTDARTGQESDVDSDYVAWVTEELKTTYEKQLQTVDNVEILTKEGVPHTEILRIARKEGVDLILMGAHSREEEPGATRYRSAAGSTMQKVAKGARAPVLIVSRPCTTCLWYFSNIVFGTDFSKASDAAFLFARKLCTEIGSRMHLFHALDMSGVHAGKIQSQDEVETLLKEAREKLEKKYLSKMEDFDNYDYEVWEGIPYVEILKFARAKNADLIIMAHHTREIDPEQAVLGSTVEQVVLRSSCPVASVNRSDKVT